MPTLINEDQVRNLKSLFNEGFDDFVLLYFQEFENKDKELNLAIQSQEFEKTRKIAHALKGNSLNVGAIALADKCTELENATLTKNIDTVLAQYKALEKLYPTVKETYLHIASSL